MITDRIGRHEVQLPINQSYNKIWEKVTFEFKCFGEYNQQFRLFFMDRDAWKWEPIQVQLPYYNARKWRVLSNYTGMTRTVQLYCPINAQIGPVDNQSDSRILL